MSSVLTELTPQERDSLESEVRIHVGSPEDMGQRFVEAWRRAERGEIAPEANLTKPKSMSPRLMDGKS